MAGAVAIGDQQPDVAVPRLGRLREALAGAQAVRTHVDRGRGFHGQAAHVGSGRLVADETGPAGGREARHGVGQGGPDRFGPEIADLAMHDDGHCLAGVREAEIARIIGRAHLRLGQHEAARNAGAAGE
eukprot:g906.t1